MSKPNILRVDDPRALEIFASHQAALRQQLVAEGLGDLIQEQNDWLRAFKRVGRIQQSGVRATTPLAYNLEVALLTPNANVLNVTAPNQGTQKKLLDYRLTTQQSSYDPDGIERRVDTDFQCDLSVLLQGEGHGGVFAITRQKDADGSTRYEDYRHTTTEAIRDESRRITTPEELDIALATALAGISLQQYGIEAPRI